jgi:NTE family protein
VSRQVAFVLGGGGHLGAAEVGMLGALFEREIRPDLIVGTSVGALHGAAAAADPTPASVEMLEVLWRRLPELGVLGSWLTDARALVRLRTHVRSHEPLRRLASEGLGVETFEELAVPFQCVAACIERAAEQWFSSGPLVDAILASASVPGLLPPIEIGGEHFIDGGIVNSIPIGRAVELGADEIYVLHVGRIDRPLEVPKRLRDVALVSFEISRRHRFVRELAAVPEGVVVHVLPTGESEPPRWNELSSQLSRNFNDADRRIRLAREATGAYLDAR